MRQDPKVIVLTLRRNQGRVRQTARELGVSPSTVIFWRHRAATGSARTNAASSTRGLGRRSTAPKTRPGSRVGTRDRAAVLALRKSTGYSAEKLTRMLRLAVCHRTVHRFLKARRLTANTPNYRRPRLQPTTHMHAKNATTPGKLQMDVKYVTPELSGLAHTCYLYAVMDIFSRHKAGIILPSLDQALAIQAVSLLVPALPFATTFIQTDNGLEFQARFRAHVTGPLSLEHHYIHKSSPNENAVIERSFRTDEEEFFWRLGEAPATMWELNETYQRYLGHYNEVRPHLGIDLLTPQEKLEVFEKSVSE